MSTTATSMREDARAKQLAALEAEVERLKTAIVEHRDQRGDDRCWLDDIRLYAAIDGKPTNLTLPPKCDFLESCRRYWEQRQPETAKLRTVLDSDAMTIGQLERENEELRLKVRTMSHALEVFANPNRWLSGLEWKEDRSDDSGGSIYDPAEFARVALEGI